MKSLIFLLAIMAVGILLQIFLSKKESGWFGLILPFITFTYSFLMVILMFETDDTTWWDTFGFLFMTNIPTIILLAIYFGCREKIRRKKALEKMNIQDLE